MRCLFLDLASHDGLLACVTPDAVVAAGSVDHRIGDHELPPLLEGCLHRARWSYEDVSQVACVVGPGGFMSLRVAVACANTLVHHLGVPGTGVHLSDLYFARTAPPLSSLSHDGGGVGGEGILWLHSTKKHELFVRGFGEYVTLWPEPTHLSLDDFLGQLPESISWMGELIPEHDAEILKRGGKRAELQAIASVLPSFLGSLTYKKKTLEPWYGRTW
ncbi:MAG: hypothetical protein PHI23_03045 [Candidatus Peribacteraceae bacterium]|nr:hypothetical protein [Candidatus Peribacteraceae bacterium]